MNINKIATVLAGAAFVLSLGIANAASALTVSCVGTPSATAITWGQDLQEE